jgi:hypothetical protein
VSYGQLWRLELEDLPQTLPPNRALTPAAPAASQASQAKESSGPAAPPNEPLSLPNTAPEAAPTPLIAKPKTWLGVVIACLLGATPIIALVLVRWQGNGAEVPATSTEAIETGSAPTQVIAVSPPASLLPKSAIAEAELEVVDAPLTPGVAPEAVAQGARTKRTPSLTSPQLSGPSPAPSTSAPVRRSWFHR